MLSKPNMYALQYLVPDKYPAVDGSFDRDVSKMCATLRTVSTKDTAVPNSALSVRLTVMLNGCTLEIKKRGQPVYMNLFCFDASHLESMLIIINSSSVSRRVQALFKGTYLSSPSTSPPVAVPR
jgi:hypothetical protein